MAYIDSKSAAILYGVTQSAIKNAVQRKSNKYTYRYTNGMGRGGRKLFIWVDDELFNNALASGLIDKNSLMKEEESPTQEAPTKEIKETPLPPPPPKAIKESSPPPPLQESEEAEEEREVLALVPSRIYTPPKKEVKDENDRTGSIKLLPPAYREEQARGDEDQRASQRDEGDLLSGEAGEGRLSGGGGDGKAQVADRSENRLPRAERERKPLVKAISFEGAVSEIARHGSFTDLDHELMTEWVELIPAGELGKFLKHIVADRLELNPLKNGRLSVPLVRTYIERWLGDEAKRRAQALFHAYLEGEKIPYFTDEEIEDVEYLGVGEGFKEQIAHRVYKELARGVL